MQRTVKATEVLHYLQKEESQKSRFRDFAPSQESSMSLKQMIAGSVVSSRFLLINSHDRVYP
jgi:hypothetical protein